MRRKTELWAGATCVESTTVVEAGITGTETVGLVGMDHGKAGGWAAGTGEIVNVIVTELTRLRRLARWPTMTW